MSVLSSLPQLPPSFDARFPVLLLPVGVQVKFVKDERASPTIYELRVRFYPDQLGVTTHEPGLTTEEKQAAQQYWDLAAAGPGQRHSLPHWRVLVSRFGVPRALWLLRQTDAQNPPQIAAADAPDDQRLTQPALAKGLPERFTVLLYTQAASDDPNSNGYGTALPSSAVKNQLFVTPQRTYAAETIPNPTTEFLHLSQVVQGNVLGTDALAVGPNPLATPDPTGVGGVDAGNYWTIDFEEAQAKGMAVTIPFANELAYTQGFKRLVVLGVRSAGAADGQQQVEQLLADHYYSDGLQLVPQGTPTNNTDAVAAGYSSRERADADASFALLTQDASFDPTTAWADRADAQHLTNALGLGTDALPPLANGLGLDTSAAQAMNRALWPATYGYFLEEMLRPLLSPAALAWTRRLFESYVLARGPVPALRVGAQPYGVLPTTRFSTWEAGFGGQDHDFAQQLQQVLTQLDATWTERLNPQDGFYPEQLGNAASQAGFIAPSTDGANLLTTLGLDATSTEYYQRYLLGPVLTDALNTYSQGLNDAQAIWAAEQHSAGQLSATDNPLYQEFASLIDPGDNLNIKQKLPPIFTQTFQSTYTKLADAFADEPAARRGEGVLLDDQPLSETLPLAPFAGAVADWQNRNYVHWLALASFEQIRVEDFTAVVDDAAVFVAPNSLFYCLLRQAVLLEYWAAAKTYLAGQGVTLSNDQLFDHEMFNVAGSDTARWAWLYSPVGSATSQPLHERLRAAESSLDAYLTNLGRLADLPTAQLERLLAEHLDLGSYRLDAWRLAPVVERLATLRQPGSSTAQGSHLGMFGWLEDGVPTDTSVPDDTDPSLFHDPDNLGYIHAPTATHGTAAALLRQGYKSRQITADASDPAANRMAVDLSSRRVRAALALLDGLQAGHSLGSLLGQSFERALQQAADPLYAQYIATFRQAFPLSQEYTLVTDQTAPIGQASEQAVRQGVDGAALLRAASAQPSYPYDITDLPTSTDAPLFADFVAAQLAQLTDDLDALGDLAVSEGIFQAARGNTDRAVAVLDGVAKGQFPPSPDVVHPAQRGLSFTQRVLLHLPTVDALPAGWPSLTPRAQVAPRLNAWLSQFFTDIDPQALSFTFGYQLAGNWESSHQAFLAETGLQPIDLLYVLEQDALQAGSTFDRLLLTAFGPKAANDVRSADAVLSIRYAPDPATAGADAGPAALRRRLPLLARLRQLLGGARPARAADLQAPGLLASPDLDAGGDYAALTGNLATSQAQLQGIVDGLAAGQAAPQAALYAATFFGLTEAVPALAPRADLLAGCALVRQVAQDRLTAATKAAQPGTVAAALDAYAALFGTNFRPDVSFSLAGTSIDPAAAPAYEAALAPPTVASLMRAHEHQPLALQEWLHGVAAVRESMNHLDKVLLMQGLLDPTGSPQLPLQPAQLSTATPPVGNPASYWLGLSWPTQPAYTPPGDALSLVQWLPQGYAAHGPQVGLWLDEWTEALPGGEQTTALTFHYDQPNAAAPQSLLLVVPPQAAPAQGTAWDLEDLLGAVNETLDIAKKRTVEPDGLAFTHLATVLPAIVAPVAQQAVTFTLDLGRLNDTARFAGTPLLQAAP